jgi:hypothetical protein
MFIYDPKQIFKQSITNINYYIFLINSVKDINLENFFYIIK